MPMWDTPSRRTSCTGKYSRESKKLCTVYSLIIPSATNQYKDHGEQYRIKWIPDYRIIIHLRTTVYDRNIVVMNSLLHLYLCSFWDQQQHILKEHYRKIVFQGFQGFYGPFQNSRVFQGFQVFKARGQPWENLLSEPKEKTYLFL